MASRLAQGLPPPHFLPPHQSAKGLVWLISHLNTSPRCLAPSPPSNVTLSPSLTVSPLVVTLAFFASRSTWDGVVAHSSVLSQPSACIVVGGFSH